MVHGVRIFCLRRNQQVQANREERKLTISGERFAPEWSEESKNRKRRTERRFGKFMRIFKVGGSFKRALAATTSHTSDDSAPSSFLPMSLQLPKDADPGAVSASFRNGVLAVTVKRVKATFVNHFHGPASNAAPCYMMKALHTSPCVDQMALYKFSQLGDGDRAACACCLWSYITAHDALIVSGPQL